MNEARRHKTDIVITSQTYLQVSPGFEDILALWDAYHNTNTQRVCVPLMLLVADLLRHTPEDRTAERGFIHLQLDGLARSILQRRMRAVYSHLNSSIRIRQKCAMTLCISITARSRQLAWDVFRNLDFTLAAFAKLSKPPRYQINCTWDSTTETRSSHDASALPTRHIFVEFVMVLLSSGDVSLLRCVLTQKVLLGNVLRHLASDPVPLASRVLRVMCDNVIVDGSGVSVRLQAALFSDRVLGQIVAISGRQAEAVSGTKGISKAACAAELAHSLLLRLCTDPVHGFRRENASGRFVGAKEEISLGSMSEGHLQARGAVKSGKASSITKIEYSSPVINAITTGYAREVDERNETVLRLLRKLKPTESRRHAEMLLEVCSKQPNIAASYIPHATYSLEPRLSWSWITASLLVGNLAVAASASNVYPVLKNSTHDTRAGELEGVSIVRSVLPSSLTKVGLSRGLQHSSGLVRHATLSLIMHILRAFHARISHLATNYAGVDLWGHAICDKRIYFKTLIQHARRTLVSILPEPKNILTVRAACECHDADHFHKMHLSLLHLPALNALAGMFDLTGLEGLGEAQVDSVRLLPVVPLKLSTPELAANLDVIAAMLNVRRCDSHVHSAAAQVAVETRKETQETTMMFTTDTTLPARVASRRLGEGMLPSELVSVLILSAGGATARIRSNAASIAIVHFASCGALHTASEVRKEAKLWLRHLPVFRNGNMQTACSFLAEAIYLSSRERSLGVRGAPTGSEFSILTSKAVAASLKVMRSVKRSRTQRLVISAYVSAVVFGILQQQDDPIPLANLVSRTFVSNLDEPLDVTQYPGIKSLTEFVNIILSRDSKSQKGDVKKSNSKNVTFEDSCESQLSQLASQLSQPGQIVRASQGSGPSNDHVLTAARSLLKSMRYSADIENSSEAVEEILGASHEVLSIAIKMSLGEGLTPTSRLAVHAHGLLLSMPLLLNYIAKDVMLNGIFLGVAHSFTALIGNLFLSSWIKFGNRDCLEAVDKYFIDSASLREICYRMIEQILPAHLPSTARELMFWYTFALDSFKRTSRESNRPNWRHKHRILLFVITLCGAMLFRARVIEKWDPKGAAEVKHAIIASCVLITSFNRCGSVLAAAVTDLVILHVDSFRNRGGLDGIFLSAPYRNLAVSVVELSWESVGTVQIDMKMAVVPLVRHTTVRTQQRLVETSISCCSSRNTLVATTMPSQRALLIELAAAILFQLTSLPSYADVDVVSSIFDTLRHAFHTAIILAGVAEADISGRASNVAEEALVAMLSPAVVVARTTGMVPDFAYVTEVETVIHRAVTSVTPNMAGLCTALVSASHVHATNFTVLIATKLRQTSFLSFTTKLLDLLPAIRVSLECQVSNKSARETISVSHNLCTSLCSALCNCSVIEDLNLVARTVYHALANYLFLDTSNCSTRPMPIPSVDNLRDHAAATLTAAYSITLQGCCPEYSILPPAGWFPSLAAKSPILSEAVWGGTYAIQYPLLIAQQAATAQLVYGEEKTHRIRCAYLASLLSTLRVITLITPVRSISKVPFWSSVLSPSAVASCLEKPISRDLSTLFSRQYALAKPTAPLIAAARAFIRATLRCRFTSSVSLTFINNLLTALSPCQINRGSGGNGLGEIKSSILLDIGAKIVFTTIAQETFDRVVSHHAFSRVLLYPSAASSSPPNIADISVPLASLLPLMNYEQNDEVLKEAVRDFNREDNEREQKTIQKADETKFELLILLHELWNLHITCTSIVQSRKMSEVLILSGNSCPEVWRSRQASLIPLLAAANGATLSPSDQLGALLLKQLDAASGGCGLAKLGYLWGDAAAHFEYTRASSEQSGESRVPETSLIYSELSPESLASSLRAGTVPDARRCAATVVRFPYARHLSLNTKVYCTARDHRDQESITSNSPKWKIRTRNDCENTIFYGYDPAWMLPFALHAMRISAIGPLECVTWGLLSLALAATSSADEGMRTIAYAVISSIAKACHDGASFREQTQVVALLTVVRNTVDAPIMQFPITTATFAAEAATVILHPTFETYVPVQRSLLRRAVLEKCALPINFLSMFYGGIKPFVAMATRSETRVIRVWILRLMLASLRGSPEDARFFRKAFILEVLMSHKSASLMLDSYARRLLLDLLVRTARTPMMVGTLVDGSGLVQWLSSVTVTALKTECSRGRLDMKVGMTALLTATALNNIVDQRGVVHGGPTGTASDFLSALRDLRGTLFSLIPSAAGVTAKRSSTDYTDCVYSDNCDNSINENKPVITRALFVTLLRLHAAVANHLSRRCGEVIDIVEIAGMCVAVDAAAAVASMKSRVLRANMLNVIVTSARADKNGTIAVGMATSADTDYIAARALTAIMTWISSAITEPEDKT